MSKTNRQGKPDGRARAPLKVVANDGIPFPAEGDVDDSSPAALRSALTAEKIISEKEYARLSKAAREKLDAFVGGRDPRMLRWINDYFLFALAYLTGLRISEVSALDWGDVDPERRLLEVRRGKGGRPRTVLFGDRTTALLRELAVLQREHMPWITPGPDGRRPVFVSPKTRRRLGRGGIHGRWKRIAEIAGIVRVGLSFHSLRHGYATRSLDGGVPLHVVQKQMGHSSIEITAVYLHFTKASAEAAARIS